MHLDAVGEGPATVPLERRRRGQRWQLWMVGALALLIVVGIAVVSVLVAPPQNTGDALTERLEGADAYDDYDDYDDVDDVDQPGGPAGETALTDGGGEAETQPEPPEQPETQPKETAGGEPADTAQAQPQPEPKPAAVAEVSKPSGIALGHKMKLLVTERQILTDGGYRPARLGCEYWAVKVRMRAGKAAISFALDPDAVTLTVHGETIGVLAVMDSAAPLCLSNSPVYVEAGGERDVTILFEVPQRPNRWAGAHGLMVIAGVGAVDAELPRHSKPPEPVKLGARYVEQSPRNLKPLLSDPIMAAVQRRGGQTLRLEQAGDTTKVSLPFAHTTGEGVRKGDLLPLTLWRGTDSLKATVRILRDGRLVLYLADEPYHQVTFVRDDQPIRQPPKTKDGDTATGDGGKTIFD
jgi:hypothetical protein